MSFVLRSLVTRSIPLQIAEIGVKKIQMKQQAEVGSAVESVTFIGNDAKKSLHPDILEYILEVVFPIADVRPEVVALREETRRVFQQLAEAYDSFATPMPEDTPENRLIKGNRVEKAYVEFQRRFMNVAGPHGTPYMHQGVKHYKERILLHGDKASRSSMP